MFWFKFTQGFRICKKYWTIVKVKMVKNTLMIFFLKFEQWRRYSGFDVFSITFLLDKLESWNLPTYLVYNVVSFNLCFLLLVKKWTSIVIILVHILSASYVVQKLTQIVMILDQVQSPAHCTMHYEELSKGKVRATFEFFL